MLDERDQLFKLKINGLNIINMIRILFLYSFLLLGTGTVFFCTGDKSTEPVGDPEPLFKEIDDVLPNPFKGFAPWVGSQNPVYETKLQYKNYTWKELEPSPGTYNWTGMEQGWGNISVTGKRVGFRISAALPGTVNHYDIPSWLVDQGIKMRAYEIDNQHGLAPDWDDPKFLEAHHNFITSLGARYDQDPRVAWIDIGSYGFWGEWHVYLNDSLAASQASKQAILEDYFSAFPTMPKVIAFDDDFATGYVTDRNSGIRNDCLGEQESNDWYLESLNNIDPTLNDRVWKTALITGEFCGGDWGAIQGTTERFDLNYAFIQQTHWSFIGPAGGDIAPQNAEHKKNLDRLYKKLGYRFVLKKFEHDSVARSDTTIALSVSVENKGVAPFYFQWPVVCYLITADGMTVAEQTLNIDIREWLPGITMSATSLQLPATLEAARYDIKWAIIDPLFARPGIWFANTGRDSLGRYLVSHIKIE
jgi:hypothetical protein